MDFWCQSLGDQVAQYFRGSHETVQFMYMYIPVYIKKRQPERHTKIISCIYKTIFQSVNLNNRLSDIQTRLSSAVDHYIQLNFLSKTVICYYNSDYNVPLIYWWGFVLKLRFLCRRLYINEVQYFVLRCIW